MDQSSISSTKKSGVIELASRAMIAVITAYFHSFPLVCLGYPTAWLFASTFFILLFLNIIKKQ